MCLSATCCVRMLRHLHPPGGPLHQGGPSSFLHTPNLRLLPVFSVSRALFQAPAALICSCPFPPPPPPPPLGLLSLSLSLQPFPSVWPETSPRRRGAFLPLPLPQSLLSSCSSSPSTAFSFLLAGWLVLDAVSLFLPRISFPPLLIPSSGLCGLISLLLGQPAPYFSVSPSLFLSSWAHLHPYLLSFPHFPPYYSSPPVSPFPACLLSVLSLLQSWEALFLKPSIFQSTFHLLPPQSPFLGHRMWRNGEHRQAVRLRTTRVSGVETPGRGRLLMFYHEMGRKFLS